MTARMDPALKRRPVKRSRDLLPTDVERFRSRIDVTGGPDACHPWTAGVDKDGYGKFAYGPNRGQRHVRAHRLALALKLGRQLGADELALHSCDNPVCCNELHLSPGSTQDNRADCTRKGRNRKGDTHPKAVLSAVIVTEIRRRSFSGEPIRRVARDLGVPYTAAWQAGTRRTWKHLP